MVLTVKLTSIAFNYFDGQQGKKDAKSANTNAKYLDVLAERQQFACEEFPSLLEFFGFMFFFPSFLAGPTFEFREYMSFVYDRLNDKVRNRSYLHPFSIDKQKST